MLNTVIAALMVINLIPALLGSTATTTISTPPASTLAAPPASVDRSFPCIVANSTDQGNGSWIADLTLRPSSDPKVVITPDKIWGWGFAPFDGEAICHILPRRYIEQGQTTFRYYT